MEQHISMNQFRRCERQFHMIERKASLLQAQLKQFITTDWQMKAPAFYDKLQWLLSILHLQVLFILLYFSSSIHTDNRQQLFPELIMSSNLANKELFY